jgi:5-hydroxyisourate hydrolase
MSGYLTTHVLDTARGCPAAGMQIALYRLEGGSRHKLTQVVTNADGRTAAPILPPEAFAPGIYELVFQVGAYFAATGRGAQPPAFLDEIPVRFGLADQGAHCHVPLLVSPYGYTTYRGS